MKRISSRQTYVVKRIGPGLIFILLALVEMILVAGWVRDGFVGRDPIEWVIVSLPLATAVIAWFAMRWFVFCLMDQVWDDGDVLVMKHRGREFSVPLSDIMSVEYSGVINPQRVTLSI